MTDAVNKARLANSNITIQSHCINQTAIKIGKRHISTIELSNLSLFGYKCL